MSCLSSEAQAAIRELAETYTRYRGVIGELSLVRKVADAAYVALRGASNCENPVAAVAEAISTELDRLGVDRYSVMRGELQGLPSDVIEVIKRVFPNVTHYSAEPRVEPVRRGPISVERTGVVITVSRRRTMARFGPLTTLALVITVSAIALVALSLLIEWIIG